MANSTQIPNFKQIEEGIEKDIRSVVKSMVKTFKFNFIYLQSVSEEQEKKTAKAVKEYRKEFWAKALKKANGDEEKAYDIHMNLHPI